MRVIGHRGASATHPENTLEAFRAAADQGADGVELDVRRSADDVLMVFHDAHLPDGRLLREVASADLAESIPTLAQALEASRDLWVNIEIKNMPDDPDYDLEHGLSVAVAGLVTAFDAASRVLVSSFNIDSLDRIRRLDPSIPLAWLVWGGAGPAALIDRAAAHQLKAIIANDLIIDQRFIDRAHDAGLDVHVWTVDDPARIQALARLGADGVITNAPAIAVAALAGS